MKRLILALIMMVAAGAAMAQAYDYKWYGLYGIGELNYGVNLSGDGDHVKLFELSGIVGFQIRKETALGTGFSYVHDPKGAFTQLPLFVELRSHYMSSRLTPFTSMRLGYSIPVGDSNGGDEAIFVRKGGLYFGLDAGARFAITHSIAVHAHLGYRLMLMNDVERLHAGLLAERGPMLFHMLGGGAGINF